MVPPVPVFATVLLDPVTALIFGAVLALASTKLVARDPGREVWRTGVWGGAWGVFYGVCVGWMYFHYPDWMFVYLRDARTLPLVPLYVVFLVLLGVWGLLGGLAGAAFVAQGKKGWAWGLAVGAVLLIAFFFWLQGDQYVRLGTLAEYVAGTARPLPSEPAVTWTSVAATPVALAVLGTRLWRGRAAPG
jgi:hypothetical protein